MTRLVFMGTPAAAVPTLERLADRVALVVTQPDRPRGRSGKPQPSPVAEAADRLGITTVKPSRSSEIAEMIDRNGPFDLGVVVAFGMLLDGAALSVPRHGYLNVHFSLLPRWRGAAPVQAAILSGDRRSGVSLMVLDPGLDTGPVVAGTSVAIGSEDTGGSLTDRLARLAAALSYAEVDPFLGGRRFASPQAETGVTYAPKLGRADRRLDLSAGAQDLARRVRALAPHPGAFLMAGTDLLRILSARASEGAADLGSVEYDGSKVTVGTGWGLLVLESVQPAGGRVMTAVDWARGHDLDRLG